MNTSGRQAAALGLAVAFALSACATRLEQADGRAVPRLRVQNAALAPGRGGELPLVPGPVRDACVRGCTLVQLGGGRDGRSFCSQFVLQAYARAGAPLTDADPSWLSPADMLHLREGDVATMAAARPLRYVGHLKHTPPPVATADAP